MVLLRKAGFPVELRCDNVFVLLGRHALDGEHRRQVGYCSAPSVLVDIVTLDT